MRYLIGDPMKALNFLHKMILTLIGIFLTGSLLAQNTFPNRPIRFIIPFPAAGATDNVARPVAAEINRATGWNVVIENKPGAGQTSEQILSLNHPTTVIPGSWPP